MTGKTRICGMDLRGGPAREYEAFRQRMKAMPLHMVVMQHDEDSLTDDAPKTVCIEQANQGSNFLFNTRGRTRDQDSNWETSLSSWANLPGLIQSFAEPGEEIHLHYETARQVAEAAVESALARSGSLAKVNRQRAERINQELQEELCQCSNQKLRSITRATRTECCVSIFPGVTGRK